MSLSNLYFRGCFEQPSKDQIDAVEAIPGGGVEGSVVDKSCAREDLNTCGKSIQDLFDAYPIYSTQKGLYKSWGDIEFPWQISNITPNLLTGATNDKWSVSTFREKISYKKDTQVLLIEDNGYEVVLYQAKVDITSFPGPFDSSKWDKKCSIKTTKIVGLPSPKELYDRYSLYKLEAFYDKWGEVPIDWSQKTSDFWSNVRSKKSNFYLSGDLILVEGECKDSLCVFTAVKDLPVNDFIISEYSNKSFTESVYLSAEDKNKGILTQIWKKVYCIKTDINKCLEYQREKSPELGYDVVQLGDKGHFVEMPIPYRLKPNTPTLDELVKVREKPVVLTQAQIDALNQP